MVTKLKFGKFELSPLERMLMESVEYIDDAQSLYDEALDAYTQKRAAIEFAALSAKAFEDKDGNPRGATNDIERRSLQKMMVAQDADLAVLRKDMQVKRRALKLWQGREKNGRLIVSARVEAE